jgi:hypothetical protein
MHNKISIFDFIRGFDLVIFVDQQDQHSIDEQ